MKTVLMRPVVLIVDDEPHIRELPAFALGKAGLDTREAADGEAALRLVEIAPPDLIVLDINMPRMDGIEVCRRLRGRDDAGHGDMPILFLSSRDDEIDRVLGIELGADDYVTKPFSPREVVARVAAILRRPAAGRARPRAPARSPTPVSPSTPRDGARAGTGRMRRSPSPSSASCAPWPTPRPRCSPATP